MGAHASRPKQPFIFHLWKNQEKQWSEPSVCYPSRKWLIESPGTRVWMLQSCMTVEPLMAKQKSAYQTVEMFFLAVRTMDRIDKLSRHVVRWPPLKRFQNQPLKFIHRLFGIAVMHLCSKYVSYKDCVYPWVKEWIYLTTPDYKHLLNDKLVLTSQKYVLNLLNYKLSAPTLYDFAAFVSCSTELDEQTQHMFCFFVFLVATVPIPIFSQYFATLFLTKRCLHLKHHFHKLHIPMHFTHWIDETGRIRPAQRLTTLDYIKKSLSTKANEQEFIIIIKNYLAGDHALPLFRLLLSKNSDSVKRLRSQIIKSIT